MTPDIEDVRTEGIALSLTLTDGTRYLMLLFDDGHREGRHIKYEPR